MMRHIMTLPKEDFRCDVCAEWMCDSQGELLMGWNQRRRNLHRVVSDEVVCLLMWQQWHQYNRYHALSK